MYSITVENERGEQLELTNNNNYTVKASGLSPVNSDIITSKVANYGGAKYVNSRLQPRNIVLTIYPKEPVETNRINLYKYIKSKRFIRVYYKNKTRNVYIDGYVESFECELFEQQEVAQVSIICPKPEFLAVESDAESLSTTVGAFSFPFYANEVESVTFSVYTSKATLIVNESDNEIGVIYTIQCYGKVVNPMIYLEDTGEYFKLNGTFIKGSVITISTLDGNKSVKLDFNGKVSNIINQLDTGSTWFKLQAGYNNILQVADSGVDNMVSVLSYTKEYGGV